MSKFVRVDGTDMDQYLENGDWPDDLVEQIEKALERMKESPGDANEEITLVLVNNFEPEEESEDEGEDPDDARDKKQDDELNKEG